MTRKVKGGLCRSSSLVTRHSSLPLPLPLCLHDQATDPRLWLSARIGWSETVLPELSGEYLRFIKPLKSLTRKCIVLDLDNTLWGGVIGDDGLAGIQLAQGDAAGEAYLELQQYALDLRNRGIVLG